MADGTILNTNSTTGDTIATDDITDGGVANGQKAQRMKVGYGTDNSYVDVTATTPLPVVSGTVGPKTTHDTFTNLSAGGVTDLDSAQIDTGKEGQLAAIVMTASVPLKGELKKVLNGAETAVVMTLFSRAGDSVPFVLPSKNYVTQVHNAGAGFDGFRLTVTNLDQTAAADVYATFFYDEE